MSRAAPPAPAPAAIAPESPEPAEFLQGSDWHAYRWTFTPTNALELERPVQIRWDFALPGGGRFTDARLAPLLQASRRLLAAIRRRGAVSGLPQRATTVLRLLRLSAHTCALHGHQRHCPLRRSRCERTAAVPAAARGPHHAAGAACLSAHGTEVSRPAAYPASLPQRDRRRPRRRSVPGRQHRSPRRRARLESALLAVHA